MIHSSRRSNPRAFDAAHERDMKRRAIALGTYLVIVILWMTCGASAARSMDSDHVEVHHTTESRVSTALPDGVPPPRRIIDRFPKWVESFSIGAKICSYAFECTAVAVVVILSLHIRRRCAQLPACKLGILLGAGTFLIGWYLSLWYLQLCGSSLITIAHSREMTGDAWHLIRSAARHWSRLRRRNW